jgi:type VI secretion system protein ImpH
VIRRLLAAPDRFTLFQAVALLQAVAAHAAEPGSRAGDGGAAAVRLRGHVGFAFPASDVAAISAGPPWEVTAHAFSLAGGFGPLPPPMTEMLMHRRRLGDRALSDFLDMFNHRLIELLVGAHRAGRSAPEWIGARPTPFEGWLRAVAGLATPGLAGCLDGVPDRAVLRHAGLVARRPASQHGLERLIADHFGVVTRVTPLVARHRAIEPEDQARIGRTGRNTALGSEAVVGRRVVDPAAGVAVRLGPLSWQGFLDMLPGRPGQRALSALAAFYARPRIVLSLVLAMEPGAAPRIPLRARAGLGRAPDGTPRQGPPAFGHAPLLGRSSWLGRPPLQATVGLHPEAAPA